MGKYSHLSHGQLMNKADIAIKDTSVFLNETKDFINNSEYRLILHSRLETLNVPRTVKNSLFNYKYQ